MVWLRRGAGFVFEHLFGCAVYQRASRRICRIETISLKRGFGPTAVGTSSAWEAGGGSCLCLPPDGGAGLTPQNTSAHHCGGTPVSRRRTGAGREPLSLRLLAEVPRDAGPSLEPWFHAPRLRGRGGRPESETFQEYKSRRPLANPRRRRHRASGVARLLCVSSGTAEF